MRVAFLVDGLWVGGAERSIAELLPELQRLGVEASVLCLRRRTEGVEAEVLAQGVDVIFLEPGTYVAQSREVAQVLRRRRPDILLSSLFRANLVARLARRTGVPTLIVNSLTNCAYEPARYRDPGVTAWRLGVVRRLDGWTARRWVDYFHAVSEAVKESAVRSLGIDARRVGVVPRGRSPERLGRPSQERRLAARQALDIDPETPLVVTVGRQDYQKDQASLLLAMARVRRRFPEALLAVAGRRGSMTGKLQDLRKSLDLESSVRFLGHVENVPDVLAAADLFAFPSLYEGMPGAVLEAMALGLPVVATDIAPVQEVVDPGRNALLVTPGAADELASAVERLLADGSLRDAFGQAGRDLFLDRYTVERSAAAMEALFRRLLES